MRIVARAAGNDAPLPRFAVDELQSMVRCGDFEHGFLRFNCRRCGEELRVPFSCKARGTCPSCMGRRMCETAALWVERLLPVRSDLGLYVHLHCLVADGVFEEAVGDEADTEGERQTPVSLPVPEPTDKDLARVLRAVVQTSSALQATTSNSPGRQ